MKALRSAAGMLSRILGLGVSLSVCRSHSVVDIHGLRLVSANPFVND